MTAIESFVNGLLQHPPVTQVELRHRSAAFDGGAFRSEIARQLIETESRLEAQLLLIQWLLELKPKNAAIRLLDAMSDSARPMDRRALAFMVLTTTAPRELEKRMTSLAQKDVTAVLAAAQAWLDTAMGQEAVPAERSRRSRPARLASAPRVCRMKITLRGIRPPIWRRFEVSDDFTLGRLHDVLQDVMGWTNSHLHAFWVGDMRFAVPDPEWPDDINEKKALLSDLLDQGVKRFVYEYDFGDDWLHDIVIERIAEPEPKAHCPRCLAGKRACPPEDCGGAWGYRGLVRVLANPKHKEYAESREWAGRWEPEAFDLEAVNRRLSRLRRHRRKA